MFQKHLNNIDRNKAVNIVDCDIRNRYIECARCSKQRAKESLRQTGKVDTCISLT